jgi:phage host-nuclease inhibitor protein Gam
MKIKIVIPGLKTEADELIRKIGELQIRQSRVEQGHNERMTQLKEKTQREIAVIEEKIRSYLIGLFGFYQAHWKELTEGGKRKFVDFAGGQIGSYETGSLLTIRNVKKVIEVLKRQNLSQCIRTIPATEEIIRDAVLANSNAVSDIKEIKIFKKEKFMVKPAKTGIAVSDEIKKLKKLLP